MGHQESDTLTSNEPTEGLEDASATFARQSALLDLRFDAVQVISMVCMLQRCDDYSHVKRVNQCPGGHTSQGTTEERDH